MDGKDKIIETILSDAAEYSEKTIEKAESDYNTLISHTQEEAQKLVETAEESFIEEQQEVLKRSKVVATLDGKKVYLSRKTEAVDAVFNRALEKLNKLEKPAYKSVIIRLIEENACENDVIILAENSPFTCQEVLSFDVVKSKKLSVKAGGKFSGGIMIESSNSDINLSFEALIQSAREGLESFVAEKLFD